jgi:hypothetical protein
MIGLRSYQAELISVLLVSASEPAFLSSVAKIRLSIHRQFCSHSTKLITYSVEIGKKNACRLSFNAGGYNTGTYSWGPSSHVGVVIR